MAMFLNNKNQMVKCPNCGSLMMVIEEVGSYEFTSDSDIFIKDKNYIRLRCAECNTVAYKSDADSDRRKINLRS